MLLPLTAQALMSSTPEYESACSAASWSSASVAAKVQALLDRSTQVKAHVGTEFAPPAVSAGLATNSATTTLSDDAERHSFGDNAKKRRGAKHATLEQLQACFNMTVPQASVQLNIGVTVLKELCRRHGIGRWPYRKVRRMVWLAERLKRKEGTLRELESLESLVNELKIAPSSPLWATLPVDVLGTLAALRRQDLPAVPAWVKQQELLDDAWHKGSITCQESRAPSQAQQRLPPPLPASAPVSLQHWGSGDQPQAMPMSRQLLALPLHTLVQLPHAPEQPRRTFRSSLLVPAEGQAAASRLIHIEGRLASHLAGMEGRHHATTHSVADSSAAYLCHRQPQEASQYSGAACLGYRQSREASQAYLTDTSVTSPFALPTAAGAAQAWAAGMPPGRPPRVPASSLPSVPTAPPVPLRALAALCSSTMPTVGTAQPTPGWAAAGPTPRSLSCGNAAQPRAPLLPAARPRLHSLPCGNAALPPAPPCAAAAHRQHSLPNVDAAPPPGPLGAACTLMPSPAAQLPSPFCNGAPEPPSMHYQAAAALPDAATDSPRLERADSSLNFARLLQSVPSVQRLPAAPDMPVPERPPSPAPPVLREAWPATGMLHAPCAAAWPPLMPHAGLRAGEVDARLTLAAACDGGVPDTLADQAAAKPAEQGRCVVQ